MEVSCEARSTCCRSGMGIKNIEKGMWPEIHASPQRRRLSQPTTPQLAHVNKPVPRSSTTMQPTGCDKRLLVCFLLSRASPSRADNSFTSLIAAFNAQPETDRYLRSSKHRQNELRELRLPRKACRAGRAL